MQSRACSVVEALDILDPAAPRVDAPFHICIHLSSICPSPSCSILNVHLNAGGRQPQMTDNKTDATRSQKDMTFRVQRDLAISAPWRAISSPTSGDISQPPHHSAPCSDQRCALRALYPPTRTSRLRRRDRLALRVLLVLPVRRPVEPLCRSRRSLSSTLARLPRRSSRRSSADCLRRSFAWTMLASLGLIGSTGDRSGEVLCGAMARLWDRSR